ncbi:MAG: winged helix-turn-helix domain-containing protein [Candidatus Nanohaloarchaea archaeon]|nr:winged helix-turn-helix domain-containing protein [Candidatus Nanohaloarchaea archaeon]
MELDFRTVKALSSPTRIRILEKVRDGGSTPTELGRELDRSKSTIASHLEKLERAGLVEKDAEEGRRRVIYEATRKADAIVSGKRRKVRFSVASSIISGVVGIALVGSRLMPSIEKEKAAMAAMEYTAEARGAGGSTGAPEPSSFLPLSDTAVIGLGAAALLVAAVSLGYLLVLRKLD